MKIISKIPAMSDNELSKLFTNALELIHNKNGERRSRSTESNQAEWSKRLDAYNDGKYKAETPKRSAQTSDTG